MRRERPEVEQGDSGEAKWGIFIPKPGNQTTPIAVVSVGTISYFYCNWGKQLGKKSNLMSLVFSLASLWA